MERITVTAHEAAQIIGVSYWLILELAKRQEIKHIRAGRKVLFRLESLQSWLNEQEKASTSLSFDSPQKGRLRRIAIKEEL